MRPVVSVGATLLLCACGKGPRAIYDADRPEHFFDLPFPNDALLDGDDRVDLSGFPQANSALADDLISSWVMRAELATRGFANNGAIYLRFEDVLDVPQTTEGKTSDPVIVIDLETGALYPLDVTFVKDAGNDPHLADNTLVLAPTLGHPMISGHRHAAVVMREAGCRPPKGYDLPEAVDSALEAHGIEGRPAVATVFTVQDSVGELQRLFADAEQSLPDWSGLSFREVTHLSYTQGETPSGTPATVLTVTYGDETTRSSYQAADAAAVQEVDLTDWPLAVYEVDIDVPNYQGLADRPYMSPGFGHISDTQVTTGWLEVDADGVLSEPEYEPMRVVVGIPRDGDGQPIEDAKVIVYDHGTGGQAYNVIQRRNPVDDGLGLSELYAEYGFAIVGRDASLYGLRYPLIDEGYGDSLGFYNIVNTPAFRDNQRQTAIDGHVLVQFLQQRANDLLPAGSLDLGHLRRMGHSLGSVTVNNGLAGAPDTFEHAFLSGSGGVFSHYFLDTGLLQDFDPSLLSALFALLDAEVPDPVTTEALLGAVLELDEDRWDTLDRTHPVMQLFQWMMDPSDPMALAPGIETEATMIIGVGDYQVPDFTSRALIEALGGEARAYDCHTTWDYDPHYCLHREQEGADILEDWLALE